MILFLALWKPKIYTDTKYVTGSHHYLHTLILRKSFGRNITPILLSTLSLVAIAPKDSLTDKFEILNKPNNVNRRKIIWKKFIGWHLILYLALPEFEKAFNSYSQTTTRLNKVQCFIKPLYKMFTMYTISKRR